MILELSERIFLLNIINGVFDVEVDEGTKDLYQFLLLLYLAQSVQGEGYYNCMIYLLRSPTLPKISLFSRVMSSISSQTLWTILFLVWVAGLEGASSGLEGRSPWRGRFLTVSSSSPDFLLILCSRSLQPILKNLHAMNFYLCLKMGIYFSLRILWKSYMLSCLTKEENFLCLKYLGRISFQNSSLFLTMKLLPPSVHSMMWLFFFYYRMRQVLMMKLEIYCLRWMRFLFSACQDCGCASLLGCSWDGEGGFWLQDYSRRMLFQDQFQGYMFGWGYDYKQIKWRKQYGNIYNICPPFITLILLANFYIMLEQIGMSLLQQLQMDFNFKKKGLFDEQNQPKTSKKPSKSQQKTPSKPQPELSQQITSFKELPLHPDIVSCLQRMGYTKPTKIQAQTLRHALKDQDLLCLSETGSGKTLSFVLPILNYIKNTFSPQEKVPYGLALIIGPTRELCIQINEYFDKFKEAGMSNISSLVLYGGIDPMKQVIQIAKKPNVIVATPGRILDHLQNTKGFHLNNIKFLVLDEADKLLNKDFQEQFNSIISIIPQDRRAYLFSATLTSKVQKLQRVSLKNPVRVEVSQKYQTVSNLQQFYIFIPSKMKDCYLVYLLNEDRNRKSIVFAQTRLGAERLSLILNQLQFSVQCLHGDMSQIQRIKSLQKFKANEVKILICTDVAARGIDISMIDFVMNYDLCDPKNYIHRVGRTARIGRTGKSVTMVTQYDVEAFKKIEERIEIEMKEYPTVAKDAELFLERLELCHQEVSNKMKKKKKESFFNKMHKE